MGTQTNSKLYGRPVAVPSNVFTIKVKNVSIGISSGGIVTTKVSWATPSLSETVKSVTV